MRNLVNQEGIIDFGIYKEPVETLNYKEYRLETPMGLRIPGFLKNVKFNQFHFFGLIGPDIMAGMAVVDLKFLANGFFYIYDRKTGDLLETKKLAPSCSKVNIAPFPEQTDSYFRSKSLTIELNGNRIFAKGKNISVDLEIKPSLAEPLRICTRAGYRGWVFTRKASPLEVSGKAELNGRSIEISSPSYLGLTDWTGGYMRKYTYWNWASSAHTLEDGRRFGMNLACGVNETSFTENAFWIDDQMTKIDSSKFVFDIKDPDSKWYITSNDGKIDLTFSPESQRGEKIYALAIASRFTQFMGTFDGKITTDSGETITLTRCPGWTEDHYAKW
jgi:uncharacterized protein DUF2804